jgi:hypothetical protein
MLLQVTGLSVILIQVYMLRVLRELLVRKARKAQQALLM